MKFLSAEQLAFFLKQASILSISSQQEVSSLSFFKRLADAPELLEQWAVEDELQAGEILFEEGESGNALYLILAGKMAVITNLTEKPNLLAVREAGEIIGEMALVEDRPRMATAAALSSAHLLRINQAGFHQLIQSKPEFGMELMRILSGRLRAESHRQIHLPHKQEEFDTLTGAYTRAMFEKYLREMYQHEKNFSLLLVDLDHFKSINDGFGHARGDEALKEFAKRAHSALREGDLLFRYGGDEFCILLPDIAEEQSTVIAQRVLSVVRETPLTGTPPLTLTLSIGVANYPADTSDSETPEDLIKIADHRAYQAKRAGRSRVIGPFEARATLTRTDETAPEISRLIEREEALETMQTFFNDLERIRRGALWMHGSLGCGQSRFLREVAANARLRNYAVFFLSGMPELQQEDYGVVRVAHETQNDAASVWFPPSSPTPFAEALAITLPSFVAERQNHGVLIALDNTDWIDPATRSGLQQILQTHFIFPIGLVYTSAAQSILSNEIYQAEISLPPFSLRGVQLWLRHNLGWEAPQDFIQQLHRATEGKPAHLQKAVARLVEGGELTLTPTGWALYKLGEE